MTPSPTLWRRLSPGSWGWRFRVLGERLRGLDFSISVPAARAGLDPARAWSYSPSPARHLRRILQQLPITAADRILDVGCGKGAAVRMLQRFPFGRVDGIELSDSLAERARRNFARLGVGADRTSIEIADAISFGRYGDYSHLYFYNPFPCEVMREVLDGIDRSLRERPRPLTVIYYNATCDHLFRDGGRFAPLLESVDDEAHRLVVYRALAPDHR